MLTAWLIIEIIALCILVGVPRYGSDYKAGYKADYEMGIAMFLGFSALSSIVFILLDCVKHLI